jgi:hypothetical protein
MFKKTKKQNKSNFLVKTANPVVTKKDLETFANRGFSEKKFNSGIVKFSRLYALNKTWVKYFLAALLGLVMSISTTLLVEVTGLYTGGFGACFQGVARVVYAALSLKGVDHTLANTIYNALFWGLYVLLNIPLTIFAYFKINKQFAKLSIVYLLVLQGMGFVWGIISGLDNIQIFGDTSTVNGVLNDNHVQCIIFAPNYFPEYSASISNGGSAYNWHNVYTSEDYYNIADLKPQQ